LDRRPIGIFDSGVGGLTVVKEIREHLPGEPLVYFGDTARVPYGIKSGETIRRYAAEDVHFLLRFDPKLIVVACNTASAAALDDVRSRVDLPVVGVIEPGARAAAEATEREVVGVIGTETTVASGAYERAITALKPAARVISRACPLFVPMVEEGRVNGRVARLVAAEYLGGLPPLGIDTLVLGCTHYPPLESVIAEALGPSIRIVDSARETALEVKRVVEEGGLAAGEAEPGIDFFATDNPERFKRLAAVFLGATPCSVTLVEPEDFFAEAP